MFTSRCAYTNETSRRFPKNQQGIRHTVTGLSLILALFVTGSAQAQAIWTSDGVKAEGSSSNSATNLQAVSDGHGGVFQVWEANEDIYAQWIDASGTVRWGSSGITVIGDIDDQIAPSLCIDGNGGIYVAWTENSTTPTYIKVQRLDGNGQKQFSYDSYSGVPVATSSGYQSNVKIVPDITNGAILVWQNEQSSNIDLYAQKISSDGTLQWGSSGKAVISYTGDQQAHSVIPDGSGGIYVSWEDTRISDSDYNIYAQRLNSSGAQQWTSSGIAVCNYISNQRNPSMVLSGTQILIGWEDYRSGSAYDVYTQALNTSGTAQWTANGTALCTASGAQTHVRIAADGSGGGVFTWTDQRSSYDIYAQKISSAGATQWTSNGIAINNYTGIQYLPEIVTDGAGGAIVTWLDYRSGSNYDVYGQEVNSSGSLQWDSNGLAICMATGNQLNHILVSDGAGGAIDTWLDYRSGSNFDVYAQHLADNLAITAPTGGESWNGTQAQSITWASRASSTIYDHYQVKASLVSGDNFPTTIDASVAAATTSKSWTASSSSVNSSTVKIKVEAYNDQSLKVAETTSSDLLIDSNAPSDFTLIAPTSSSTTSPQPTFQWNATTDNLSGLNRYELWIDGALVQSIASTTTSYTLTSGQMLSDGNHTWYIKAVDNVGIVKQSSSWTLNSQTDQVPPNAFDLASPANNSWTSSTNPTFTWNATTDAGSGMQKYKLYVDGTLKVDNISTSTTSLNSVTLTAGSHTWYVVAVDNANNERNSTSTYTIKIDNAPPTVFDLVSPSNNAWTNDTTPTLQWQASSDAGIGLSKYEVWIDGVLAIGSIASTTTSVDVPSAKTLSESSHTWSVVAYDGLGNTRISTSTFNIHVDVTPPNAFDLTAPANNAYSTTSSPTFSWQSTSDAASGFDEFQLWIDGSLNKSGLTGTSTTPASGLSDGTRSWTVKALDNAGNVRTASSRDVVIDATQPVDFTLSSPASGSTIHSIRPTFQWTASSDATSGFQKYEVYVDGTLKSTITSASQTSYTITSDMANGAHSWYVKAYDNAGNVRTKSTISFTVSVSAPVFTSSSTANATEDIAFSYTATATDADPGDALTYSFENYPSWMTWTSGSTISGTPREGHTNTSFIAKVTDGLFTTSMTVNVTVTAVNDPPQLVSDTVATATEDVLFTYTAQAVDPDDATLQYTFSNLPSWLSPSGSNKVTGTPTEGTLGGTFKVTVSDGKLAVTSTIHYTVQAVNDAPDLTSSTTANATEHQYFSYTATATDPENNPLSYTYSNYPSWLSPVGATISGTPPEGATSSSFKVTVSDGSLTDQMTVTLTLTLVNDKPEITSSSSVTATEHQYFIYTPTATDPENNTVTFSFSSYPQWLTPASNNIHGTPPEGSRSTTFKVIASDGSLSDELTVTVNMNLVNDAPSITSDTVKTATEDVAFSYTATATDPENDALTFTFTEYASWLTPSGATLSGTPREGDKTSKFKVTVSDGSLTDQESVRIIINAVNDAPDLTSPSTAQATEDIAFSYTATASDPENDPLSYTFTHYPHWLTPSGNQLNGTPREGAKDTSFVVTVSDGSLTDQMTVILSVTAVNDAPVLSSATTASATEDIFFSYTAQGSDIEGDPLTFGFENFPTWLSAEGNVISGTPTEGKQDTSFVVRISDGTNTTRTTVTLSVIAVNDAPVITSASTAYATEDVLFTYTPTATDIENNSITFQFIKKPVWMTATATSISGTPLNGMADTSFVVVASDQSLTDTLKVQVIIAAVNDAPVITSDTLIQAIEDSVFTYACTAEDVDGPLLTYSYIAYPSWMEVVDDKIKGAAPNGVLTATFKAIVNDQHPEHPLADTALVTIHVTPVNDPPEFAKEFQDLVLQDMDSLHYGFSLKGFATDQDDPEDSLKWAIHVIGDLNASAEVDTLRNIARVHIQANEGVFPFEIIVSDPHGASAKDTLTITLTRTTAVDGLYSAEIPDDFTLYANYPNPFNPSTTIRYGVPRSEHVTISIYNILGQEVERLLNSEQSPGYYEVRWQADQYAAGIYFYRIQAGNWQQVKRMLLLK